MNPFKLKFSLLIILYFCFVLNIFSQDLRKQAEENPLSTVFYLLSKTDKDDREREKACLAVSLASVDRFDKVKAVVNLVENDSYINDEFIGLVYYFIKIEKLDEATKLSTILLDKSKDDEYRLRELFKPLIILKRDNEVLQSISKLKDSDKIDSYFELAKIYLELNQPKNALTIIKNVTYLVDKSKYGEDKAILSLYYAKLGIETEALRFLQESIKNLNWKTGKPEYTEGRIIDKVIETYRVLGKDKEANEILEKQGIAENIPSLIQSAEIYFSKGNLNEAIDLLEQSLKLFDPKLDEGSFDLNGVISLYLKLGKIEKAEEITKSLKGNEYLQQTYLIKIIDSYIKNNNKTKAFEILSFALEQTKKIDTSEAENGSLWTSGKWDQAKYQSQIIKRLIEMQLDKEALELISNIQKPYLKAALLTEYVVSNKKRISSKKLSVYLDEAVSLLKREKTDIFDSRRYDVFAFTSRAFAEIGMKEKSSDIFSESLNTLSKEVSGASSGLLFGMCSIGVEFDKAKIKPSKNLKQSLKTIIKNWEDDEDY